MEVTISELRSICNKLLQHIETSGYATINIERDFYWNIPRSLRYDSYEEPKELTIGQLSDDWAELQKILNDEAAPLGYALVWLSSILRIIGEEVAT